MPKFQMKTAATLQGDFRIRDLNLLLIFQVNCPGCFIYALPLATKLHQKYGDHLNVLGLSTAFEDFDLNTAEHSQHLLQSGTTVGATKRYFQQHGTHLYDVPIQFPVAFDRLGQGHELFDDTDVEHVCQLSPAFHRADPEEQADAQVRVKRFLKQRSPAAYTFTVNQLQGTPSWLLFDASSTILAQWFGHRAEAEIMSIITRVLEST